MKQLLFLLSGMLMVNLLHAQTHNFNPTVNINGLVDIYYSYDLGEPKDGNRPGFFYSYNRHNEVNLNLGMVKTSIADSNFHANLGLMAGTYANANLAAEPGVLKNVFEANAGVKLLNKKSLWLDAGIFSSHIGFESAIGKDCWNLTRSILAENSPYYESGVKLTYTSDNSKWLLSGLVLNGWQRIQRVPGNSMPSFGTQVLYKPIDKVTLNSSTFIGTDKPDTATQMRYFHNFYSTFQFNPKLGLIAGFDCGAEQVTKDSADYNVWYSPVLILKYSPGKVALSARAEYFNDDKGVIIATGSPNGFQTFGYSLNLDYAINSNVVWRIEGRTLSGKDKTFLENSAPTEMNTFITTSLSVWW